jgi:hypothetical protein
MKPLILTTCAASALMVLAGNIIAAPTPAAPIAPAVEAPTHQSVFVDRKGFGRDPFFPNSQRRLGPIQTNKPVEVNVTNLSLKGVSGTTEKRLAIINNRTFEVGEEGDLRVGGQVLRIKCVEVRDRSVLITVNGISKELFLGQRY